MKAVLFVCIGNACRSPMAEAFANHYGSDVLRAFSCGLSPTITVAPLTVTVMKEKNIDVSGHVPEMYDPLDAVECDIIVNMSKFRLPGPPNLPIVEWDVPDPFGSTPAVHRQVRDQIEQLVMRLILELRKQPSRGRPVVSR